MAKTKAKNVERALRNAQQAAYSALLAAAAVPPVPGAAASAQRAWVRSAYCVWLDALRLRGQLDYNTISGLYPSAGKGTSAEQQYLYRLEAHALELLLGSSN
jgi:hypothetical protein